MNKPKIFLLLIVIIALFFRTYHLKTIPPGLYPDEAMNGSNALEAIQKSDFKAFYPENNGREGLFINIQAFFLKLLMPLTDNAPQPWMLRLPSALLGTLTVLGLYFLASALFSNNAAFFSSFFLATSFWHILFSRIGFRAIMAPLLLTWALYYFIVAIRNSREGALRKSIIYAVVGGILYGLGFYTYIAYRITPLLFLLFIPFYRKEINFWRITSIFVFAAVVIALPLGIYFLEHPADFFGRTTQVSVFSSADPVKDLALNTLKTLGMFNVYGDFNWRHNYSGRPELFWPVGILFLIGTLIGLKRVVSMDGNLRFQMLLIFGWLVLAALPVIVSDEGLPHALRSILMIPPIFMLAGIGGGWLYETIKFYARSPWHYIGLTVFLLLLIFEAYTTYFIGWAKNPNTPGAFSANYVKLGEQLNALPREVLKYVVVEGGGVLVHGIPMPSQTVMYITDTYTGEKQRAKNIYYILPGEEKSVPPGALKFYLR